VWTPEFGLSKLDRAWRLALVWGVGCRGGACRARGLDTYVPSEGIAFSQLVSELDATRCSAYAASKSSLTTALPESPP
jgi:hypothetical protein